MIVIFVIFCNTIDLFNPTILHPLPPGARVARLPAHQHRTGGAGRRGARGGEAAHGRREGQGREGAQHRHRSPWPGGQAARSHGWELCGF